MGDDVGRGMNETAFVLIVATDPERGQALVEALDQSKRSVRLAKSVVTDAGEALASLKVRSPDVVVLDGAPDAREVARRTYQTTPDAHVILIAPSDETGKALQAVGDQAGRGYEVIDSFEPRVVAEAVHRAARRLLETRQTQALQEQTDKAYEFEGILGSGPALLAQIKRLQKLAKSKSTILIMGETGTGKELFARAIHAASPRARKPYKTLNCAAISENLIESELFGHVKGAFTGAITDRKGILHAADGGTVFLDEIGDMPLAMQAKLLRALENGEVLPVGSNDPVYVDVRFVAATHRDLTEMFKEGSFREDLFYRLHASGALRIPPLRNRPEDVPILVRRFIEQCNRENDLHVKGITPEALRRMMNYKWPGNVRELYYSVERMCIETDHDVLQVDDLPDPLRAGSDLVPVGLPGLAGMSMPDLERWHILNTLRLCDGKREKAAQVLKISPRTLYRKLKEYGVTEKPTPPLHAKLRGDDRSPNP